MKIAVLPSPLNNAKIHSIQKLYARTKAQWGIRNAARGQGKNY
jgi:hypothetical protein